MGYIGDLLYHDPKTFIVESKSNFKKPGTLKATKKYFLKVCVKTRLLTFCKTLHSKTDFRSEGMSKTV